MNSTNTLQTVSAQPTINKYDRTWLNKQLKDQLEILQLTKKIRTKIQLYENLPYTKAKFDYWIKKNGNTDSTQELLKKIDEILESRLITHGFEQTHPAFTIFLLKNNYGYQDKKEIESNNNYVFKVTRGDLPASKRKAVLSTVLTNN